MTLVRLGFAFVIVAGASIAIAACESSSSSSSSGSATNDGGFTAPDGGGGGTDAPPGGLKGGGALNLYSARTLSTFSGAFAPASPGSTTITPGCTVEAIGACQLIACMNVDAASNPTPTTTQNAGPITVTGGLIPAAGITMMVASNGAYTPVSGTTALWTGGETLTFVAGGGGVPAFTQTAVAPPAGLSITSPVLATGSSLVIPRSADFVLQWSITGPAVGKVNVTLGSTNSGGMTKSLACALDIAPLTGTIPSATLGKLDAGPGALTFGVSSTTTSTIGDYSLMITLATPATASGEDLSFVNATVQ